MERPGLARPEDDVLPMKNFSFCGYLTIPHKLPKIFKFCFYQNTSERLFYKLKKYFENIFINEIKRAYTIKSSA